jgi:thiol:disulfide interchange protein DsbD
MKKLSYIVMIWLLGVVVAYADIPKAELKVEALNAGKWPAEFKIILDVPIDHHAYLDKGDENIYIPVTIDPSNKLATSQLKIDSLQSPVGVRDEEVKASVLRGQGEFKLSLVPLSSKPLISNALEMDVNYQLCNDITHVCFRPQTAKVGLTLPVVAAAIVAPAKPAVANAEESVSITDQLLSLFKDNQDNVLVMFILMFLAGVLSVATPCVYPMLPITSMLIVSRANGVAEKEKLHALAYSIGIIGTYMMLGLMAGMTGGAFNTFMQSAAVNIGFALFFAFFAIALLGFYELAFMQNEVHSMDQNSSKVSGLAGTWLMGTVAGLVISPCVGPIVFALLLQVADNIAAKAAVLASMGETLTFTGKLAIAWQGSIMMGGFGLGVGLPFFVVSVVKFKKMPKAGYWMNKIKYAFGLMILYFAYVYFTKGMGVLGVEPSVTLSIACGMLAVWLAVVNFNVLSLLPADAMPNEKMHHYVGVMALIIGVWLLVAGLGQTPIIPVTQAATIAVAAGGAPASEAAYHEEGGVKWYRTFEVAQKAAKESGKPIFIDFYASWCANCLAFKAEVVKNPELNKALRENAIAMKLVDKEPEFEKFREMPDHRQLKIGLPYFAIISPQGDLIWSGTDYKASEKMISVIMANQG